jgi:hypothetical protein
MIELLDGMEADEEARREWVVMDYNENVQKRLKVGVGRGAVDCDGKSVVGVGVGWIGGVRFRVLRGLGKMGRGGLGLDVGEEGFGQV